MKRVLPILSILAAAVLVAQVVSAAQAEVKGRYRVHLPAPRGQTRTVEGELSELPDGSYEIRTKHGAVVKVSKSDVLRMEPLEDAALGTKTNRPAGDAAATGSPLRRPISDEEIEQILAGISAQLDESAIGASADDLMADLPLNEDGLQDMLRRASLPWDGKTPLEQHKNVFIRPHFVLVSTASRESTTKLAARMESVWRWNVRFMEQLKLKPLRPDYKLEVFYFGTFKEYHAYTTNEGFDIPASALGYYKHDINRSHFFDLWDWPFFENVKEQLKDKTIPHERRQFIRNYINAWVEFENQNTIQHELGHHIHFNIGLFTRRGSEGGTAPTWLVEGTTMLFEVPPVATGAGGAGLGELNDARLDEFRKFPKWDAQSLRLFVLDNQAWHQGYNYPRGWALVYYLWKEHKNGLSKYYQMILDRDAGVEPGFSDKEKEFNDCFGVIDEKWVESFYKFIDKLQVRQSRLPPRL